MSDLHALAAAWDHAYNGVAIRDPWLGYIVLTVQRLLIGWAAILMLRSLGRYLAAALPPPITPVNVVFWTHYWLYLRLRDFPLLKIGAVGFAALLLLQIPTGLAGALSAATWYLLLAYLALIVLLVGLTHLFNVLRHRIEHPQETHDGPH